MPEISLNFFFSILETNSMVTFLLAFAVVSLFLAHAFCVGAFLLDTFFDASFTTAAERAHSIKRFLMYIVTIQVVIAVLFVILIFRHDSGIQ